MTAIYSHYKQTVCQTIDRVVCIDHELILVLPTNNMKWDYMSR